ncbi:MAG: TetR/AcrR family transcriptional regulator [Actinomycetota bacterium]
MGSPKQYDREELLDRSIELFRVQGYEATSTAALVEELGVNRKSMYAEFGSKQGLFEAALERYDREHLTRVLAPIEAPDADLDTIRAAFRGYAAASEGWESGRGCLLCNTAVERAALDPASRRHVDRYLARITAAFANALGNAERAGELRASTDVETLARFLTTSLVGVAASIRAEAEPAQLHATSAVIATILDGATPQD